MSEQKKQGIIAAQKGLIVRNGPKMPMRVHFKVLGIAAIIIVGAFFCVGGIALYRHHRDDNNAKQIAQFKQSGTAQSDTEYIRSLDDAGSYTEAQAVIAEHASSAANSSDRASWYIQAYTTAMNAAKYTDALTYAQKAYAIQDNSADAYAIAQVYEQLQDKTNAVKYLQIATSKLDKTAKSYLVTQKQYNQELVGLE